MGVVARLRLAIVLPLVALVCTGAAFAFSTGVDGYSGNPATNAGDYCSICHTGGVLPTVTLSGPTSVNVGTVHTYTLEVRGGQQVAAGLDVSATAGTLSVIDAGTHLQNGEITQNAPRAVDLFGRASFTFDWTAPAVPGSATLYAAGNSVDLAGAFSGDAARAVSMVITVAGAAQTPGEASGATLNPLLVTGRDPVTGVMSIAYESPCEATDNNVYFGALADVASYTYSGEVCGIGTGGTYGTFDPGPGSAFFVVVGNKASDEGSYGLDLDASGTSTERPPYTLNTCSTAQTLANSCD